MTTKVDVAKASAQARLASINESRVKIAERLTPSTKPTKVAKAKAADAKDGLSSLLGKFVAAPAVAAAATTKHATVSAATTTRDKTAAGIDSGVEAAVPAAQTGVDNMSAVNDKVHDLLETFLGTLSAKIDEIPAKKDAVLASAPLLKDAPAAKKAKCNRKGKGLITFGLLALAGAGAAYYLSQKQRNDDPWAVADDELGGAPLDSYQPAMTTETESTVTTVVTPADMQTDATVSEDLLVAGDAARPNDALNPNPHGYTDGVANTPRIDDAPGRYNA